MTTRKELIRHHYFARKNELFLDFDKEPYDVWHWREIPDAISLLLMHGNTKGHYHGIITMGHECAWDWHFIKETFLGSDPKRASADLARAKSGATKPSLLIRFGARINNFRAPDFSCDCPKEITNKDTGKMERLRACKHLRNYKPHHWKSGTLTWKSGTLTQAEEIRLSYYL